MRTSKILSSQHSIFAVTFAILVSSALSIGCAKEVISNPIDASAPEIVAGTSEGRGEFEGRILDEKGRPASLVSIAVDGVEFVTGLDGRFRLTGANPTADLLIRKVGDRKLIVRPTSDSLEITLQPLVIRGVYVPTVSVRTSDRLMQSVLQLIETTELNALVIDVKDDDGHVNRDLAKRVLALKEKGIYLIARVVAFKDNTITRSRPELAIMSRDQRPWHDRNGSRYLNPLNPLAHEYLVSIAREAVAMGFDEIQYDYVRFPTDGNLGAIAWEKSIDWKSRTMAIAALLKRSRIELGAIGAFLAADVFGITAHDSRDSGIGQHVETVSQYLDFVCPMVYPSGYAQGTNGISKPPESPGPIVGDSVRRYRVRAPKEVVVRPWLQAFKDYNSYSGKFYGAEEIRAQIFAAEKAGGEGFLLWNAGGRYTNAGLASKKPNVIVGIR
jgi:hypothetical protein